MKRFTVSSVLFFFLRWLWRLALTAAVLAALCVLGVAMVLNLVFTGPSGAARDQLALTLLESEYTRQIPARFLGDEAVAQLSGNVVSPTGSNDPDLVRPATTGEAKTGKHTTDTYTAQVWVIPASNKVYLLQRGASQYVAAGEFAITAEPAWNSSHFATIDGSGVLRITDDAASLQGLPALPCGPVLLLDATVNESLFNGVSGFAPRAAIGQTAEGTVIFISTDGWTRDHVGATYQDIIRLMVHYGAVNACLLDADALCHQAGYIAVDLQEG